MMYKLFSKKKKKIDTFPVHVFKVYTFFKNLLSKVTCWGRHTHIEIKLNATVTHTHTREHANEYIFNRRTLTKGCVYIAMLVRA